MDSHRERELNDLKQQQEKIARRIKDLMSDEAGDMMSDAKDALHKKFDFAADRMREMGDQVSEKAQYVRDQARDAARKADDYTHENPWTVVAVAAAVGAVLGMLLSRNDRK